MQREDYRAETASSPTSVSRATGGRIRVVLQQNMLSHYREALFKLLGNDPEIEYLIVADKGSDTPHLGAIDRPEEKFRFARARLSQIRLGKGLILFWQPEAVRICMQVCPDAIIALSNPYSLTTWAILILGRIKAIPVLLWGHGLLESERGPKWWVRKIFYRLASGQLLYGDNAKKLLVERGFAAQKLFVVYNSLDYDAQRAAADETAREDVERFRASLGLSPEDCLVAFTGRLQRIKRLDMLLDAAALFKSRGKKLHVALVGKGDEKDSLEQLSRRLGIEDQVHFLGQSYDERFLAKVFKASGACVIPSGAGLTVMHAMTYGTPVILPDNLWEMGPEWEAVQDGVTGFFYHAGDVGRLTEKIEQVGFGAFDRQSMRQACEGAIRERYNPHVQVKIFADAVKLTVVRPSY